jgi:hypothetical protein
MGIFDNIRQRLVPAKKNEPKLPNKLLTGELGSAGTNNTSGYINEDFNPTFNESSAIDTYDEMRKTDATVAATLKALKLPILAARTSIKPADEEDEKQIEIAEFISMNLFEHMEGGWANFLREALGFKDFGFYYFEKVYEVKDGKILLKKLAARQPSAHARWSMTTTPGIAGITQQLPTLTPEEYRDGTLHMNPEIPRSKLVLFTNNREGENWAGVSSLRSAYIHWFFKNKLYRLDGIKHERGAGILNIGMPDGSSDADKSAAKELGENFKINESSYIVRPSSEWTVELMTGGISDQTAGLMASVQHHDREIAKNVLAQFIDLGAGDSGSFALSKDQSGFFLLGLKATANYMSGVINEELIKELVDLNFGKQEAYPKLVFSKIGQIDFKEQAEVLEKLVNIGAVELTPNIRVWTHDTFDYPELTPEEAQEADDHRIEEAEEQKQAQADALEQARVENENNVSHETIEEEPEEKELAEHPISKKKAFKPFRILTLAEERIRFAELKTFFDGTEEQIKRLIAEVTVRQRDKFIKAANRLLQAGNVTELRKLTLSFNNELIRELKIAAKKALEEGKKTAAREMGVSIPTTPSKDIQVMNARIDQAIESRSSNIEANVKNKAIDSLRKGIGATAAAFALRQAFDKAANIHNNQLSGSAVATNLNVGRSLVIDKNIDDIHALQRSEILDEKTCPMCLSVDGKVVEKDDPFSKIDQVHTNCRGIWVAILKTDAELPTPKPIPKSILNRFDTIDGVPTANNFKQIKKPIINKTSRVAEAVERGTLKNPNLDS